MYLLYLDIQIKFYSSTNDRECYEDGLYRDLVFLSFLLIALWEKQNLIPRYQKETAEQNAYKD